MVRLPLTVTFSFTSGGLAVVNAYIIIIVIVGILTLWFFANGVYKSISLSGLDVLYLLNLFLLSTVSLAIVCFNSTNYQIITIISISLSLAVCLVSSEIKNTHTHKYSSTCYSELLNGNAHMENNTILQEA